MRYYLGEIRDIREITKKVPNEHDEGESLHDFTKGTNKNIICRAILR